MDLALHSGFWTLILPPLRDLQGRLAEEACKVLPVLDMYPSNSQRLQYPLIKEYTLNYSRTPIMI